MLVCSHQLVKKYLVACPAVSSREFIETDGFQLVDDSTIEGVEFTGKRDIPKISRNLRNAGVDVMILMSSKDIDQRELSYGSRSTTAYTSQITVLSINLHTKQPVRKRWVSQIEYTQLKAQQKAEEAVRKLSSELATRLKAL